MGKCFFFGKSHRQVGITYLKPETEICEFCVDRSLAVILDSWFGQINEHGLGLALWIFRFGKRIILLKQTKKN